MALTQIALLPGAASPFRLIKSALLIGGLALIIGLLIAARLWRGTFSLPRGPLAMVLVAYPLLLLISSLWSISRLATLYSAAAAAVLVLATLVIGTLDDDTWDRIMLGCAAGAAISSLVMLLQMGGISFLVVATRVDEGRLGLTGLSGNPADLAIVSVLLLPLLLTWAQARPGWWRWLLPGLLAVVILLSQTWTGIGALGLVAITWLLLQRPQRILLTVGIIVIVPLLLAGGAIVSSPTRFENAVNRIRSGDWYNFLSARPDGWTATAQMIRNHPLLGVGGGGYTYAYYPNRLAWLEARNLRGRHRGLATHFETAHCDPLQVVAELGLCGVAWLVVLTVVIIRYRRGDRSRFLMAAGLLPLALLHYPAHLAIGLAPLLLALAKMLSREQRLQIRPGAPAWRALLALLVVVVSALVVVRQASRIESSYWLGMARRSTDLARSADSPQAVPVLQEIERQILERIPRHPASAAVLWRLTGQARLARGAGAEAESAFKRSYNLWAHEETEIGLGLSLAQQKRRTRALYHLGRVCTVNPTLLKLISDEQLQRSVRDLVRSKTRARPRFRSQDKGQE
jgi:O-antigen ligase